MELNRDRLFDDLVKLDSYFRDKPSRSMILNDYGRYTCLEDLFYQLTGFSMDLGSLFSDPYKVQKIIDRYEVQNYKVFEKFSLDNGDYFVDLFANFCEMCDSVNFQSYPYYGVGRNYSEKDFKDVLLGFYSTFGNDIYKIVKKYFDEGRIQLNIDNGIGYGGVYMPSIMMKSGYITLFYSGYNTVTITALSHELGHAVDYEKFIYPQQKKYSTIRDLLLEVPSMTFETAFYDYLGDNRIDTLGGLVMSNRDISYLYQCSASANHIYSSYNVDMDLRGNVRTEDGVIYPFRDHLIYGISTIFALYLNEIRKQDPNGFKKIMNDLCTLRYEQSLEESIRMIGLTPEEFCECSLLKDEIDSKTKTLKRKFKY